jgi:hypothetical protein
LHFFGHGVKNDREGNAFGYDFYVKNKGEGDSLLFESQDGSGEADFVNQKELKKLCATWNVTFDFVFVAACHS